MSDWQEAGEEFHAAAAVRPYAWTGGRTVSEHDLPIEALVSTSEYYLETDRATPGEYHAVAALCDQPRSVAEVAALLRVPFGVARVLLGDMVGLGLLHLHRTASSGGEPPGLDLMERVLAGLHRL